MTVLTRVRSVARGLLWLVRAGGLRERLGGVERRLEATEGRMLAALQEARRYDVRNRPEQVHELRAFERRLYSQNGEDGILQEMLRRIGVTDRYFVEFGVESGRECNCAFLALEEGWRGLFLEADDAFFAGLRERYRDRPGVRCVQAQVTSANIEALLEAAAVPPQFDVLSIDIDGNDYWVWQAVTRWRPRLVVIEYNASYPPPRRWVMAEDVDYRWNGTSYHGASLTSLVCLGRRKGYTLAATDSRGVNAFFVRDDLFTPERFFDPALHYHYAPPNYGPHQGGHPPGNGPFVEV